MIVIKRLAKWFLIQKEPIRISTVIIPISITYYIILFTIADAFLSPIFIIIGVFIYISNLIHFTKIIKIKNQYLGLKIFHFIFTLLPTIMIILIIIVIIMFLLNPGMF